MQQHRLGRMLLMAYLPAVVALAATIACMVWLAVLGNDADKAMLWGATHWLPLVGVVLAVVFGLAATLRLWRWQKGDTAQACTGCGGLLGRRREGPEGPYRQCLACGRPNPVT